MKPWLATDWRAEDLIDAGDYGRVVIPIDEATLMTAAPEMCRALLIVEYATHRQGSAECPICAMPPGHHHECHIDAALTKAGLPDQESRDAARKEIGI